MHVVQPFCANKWTTHPRPPAFDHVLPSGLKTVQWQDKTPEQKSTLSHIWIFLYRRLLLNIALGSTSGKVKDFFFKTWQQTCKFPVTGHPLHGIWEKSPEVHNFKLRKRPGYLLIQKCHIFMLCKMHDNAKYVSIISYVSCTILRFNPTARFLEAKLIPPYQSDIADMSSCHTLSRIILPISVQYNVKNLWSPIVAP